MARLSCEECQTWIIDLRTGTRKQRRGEDVPRAPNQPTPCGQCPKQSPALAHLHELTPENFRTFQRYLEARATGGRCLSDLEAGDALQARLFALIDVVVRQADIDRAGLDMALLMGGLGLAGARSHIPPQDRGRRTE